MSFGWYMDEGKGGCSTAVVCGVLMELEPVLIELGRDPEKNPSMLRWFRSGVISTRAGGPEINCALA